MNTCSDTPVSSDIVPISFETTFAQSILKGKSHTGKKHTVSFLPEEFEVIGYGGDEYSSDEEDGFFESSNDDCDIIFPDGEDEKELQKLTRINTDFNSVTANLDEKNDKKTKKIQPLELGKPLTDGEGKKQTLLVSVEPFATSQAPPKKKATLIKSAFENEDKNKPVVNNSAPYTNSIASSRKTHLFKLLDTNDAAVTQNNTTVTNRVAENNLTNLILNQALSQKGSEDKVYSSNIEVTSGDVYLEPIPSEEISPPPPAPFNSASTKEQENCTNVEVVPGEPEKPSDVVKMQVMLEDKFPTPPTPPPMQENGGDVVLHPIDVAKTIDENVEDSQTNVHVKSNLRISLDELKESPAAHRGTNRKTQITRGTILTKVHEPIRTKKFLHLSAVDITDDSTHAEKTDKHLLKDNENRLAMYKNEEVKPVDSVVSKNAKNSSDSPKTTLKESFASEVAVTMNGTESTVRENPIQLPLIINSSYSKINAATREKHDEDVRSNHSHVQNGGKPDSLDLSGTNLELESRELAGEPDGRADSDESSETTASPYVSISATSPPANPRSSFLHGFTKDKPKVAVRPTSFSLHHHSEPLTALCEQFVTEQSLSQSLDYLSTESSLKMKRQAPQPPPTPLTEPKVDHDSPDQSPQQQIYSHPQKPKKNSLSDYETKRVSLSHDNLSSDKPIPSPMVEKARKINGAATKMRFTLKKFLRFNSKDEDKPVDDAPPTPLSPKPRPEIIHPIDLNKSGVEVLRGDKTAGINNKASPTIPMDVGTPKKNGAPASGRPSKPPPPPRNPSTTVRPARPPPPETNGTVYANIGEPRQNIAPTKPQRTASIKREHSVDYEPMQNKKLSWYEKENIYEPITVTNGMFDTRLNNNHVKSFEQESKVISKPSEDTVKSNSLRLSTKENSIKVEPPFNVQNSHDSDNDVYYPYCFFSTEDNNEDDHEKRKARLRLRKGRSVVHKSLEDNYGAVIIANHEALAQVLDQLQLNPVVPPHFRSLSASSKIRWSDFSNIDITKRKILADRIFYSAEWNSHPVTLCISQLQHSPCTLPQLYTLSPITEFTDFVSAEYLTTNKILNSEQVAVAVLSSQFFDSLASYCNLKPATQTEKDIGLIVIQLVNVLKCLQTCDQIDISMQELVLCREEEGNVPRLCVAPISTDSPILKEKGKERITLCQAMVAGTEMLLPSSPLSEVLKFVLKDEHASSLSQAKALVEFWLWGPADTSLTEDRQAALQRWLDLERATVLHGLVISRNPQVSLMEHCHLMFLVRTNAKIMADSSYLLETYNKK
ncbi:unnamed protein product [Bemisia tabaci]|uniref:Uncharacterized protein n=1 Tax=Bemisia tabaci TaxID=7038 RepID=A0AAI8Y653_BEMTA|nr:unnamed protein product [Bemisia tabaci]